MAFFRAVIMASILQVSSFVLPIVYVFFYRIIGTSSPPGFPATAHQFPRKGFPPPSSPAHRPRGRAVFLSSLFFTTRGRLPPFREVERTSPFAPTPLAWYPTFLLKWKTSPLSSATSRDVFLIWTSHSLGKRASPFPFFSYPLLYGKKYGWIFFF